MGTKRVGARGRAKEAEVAVKTGAKGEVMLVRLIIRAEAGT